MRGTPIDGTPNDLSFPRRLGGEGTKDTGQRLSAMAAALGSWPEPPTIWALGRPYPARHEHHTGIVVIEMGTADTRVKSATGREIGSPLSRFFGAGVVT